MMPSFIKNSKLVYLYDEINKELISKSQTDLGKITNSLREFTLVNTWRNLPQVNSSILKISTYKANGKLYLNQFLFSNIPLDGYTNNLKSSSDLLPYINVIKLAGPNTDLVIKSFLEISKNKNLSRVVHFFTSEKDILLLQ